MTVESKPLRLTLNRVTEEELGELLGLDDKAIQEFIDDRQTGADCFLTDSLVLENYASELHFLITGKTWEEEAESSFDQVLKGGRCLGSQQNHLFLNPDEVEAVAYLLSTLKEDDWQKRFKDLSTSASMLFDGWDEELCQILIEYLIDVTEFYVKVAVTNDALLKNIES